MGRNQESNFIERPRERGRCQLDLAFLFIPILLVWNSVVNAAEATSVDSIRVDGKLVQVDAQVQFDSLARSNRARTDNGFMRQLRSDIARGSTSVSLEMLAGMGQGPLESLSWSGWTGQYDLGHAIGLEQQLKGFQSRALNRNGWRASVQGQILIFAQQLGGFDVQQIPDSVIGFIAQESGQDWSAVTYERYSNGIETDTVRMVTDRDLMYTTALQVGVALVHRKGGNIKIRGGALLNWQNSSRVKLEGPEIDGEPWRMFSVDAKRVLPLVCMEVGQEIITFSGWQFSVQGSVKLMPKSVQNCWLGIGLTATVKSNSRGNLAR
ncbi:MAG: hypothetical protein CL834_05595 [Crocinitomicaceae bacterium]|nr:hypothetical protein [Crocinitomicaceae bacterium]|tara:strand:+ start:114 stop:1082 length:969 start_codon:yes stop_codon:yes gene_type:complete